MPFYQTLFLADKGLDEFLQLEVQLLFYLVLLLHCFEYHPDIVQHLDQKWNSSLFQDLFALLLAYVTSLLYRFV